MSAAPERNSRTGAPTPARRWQHVQTSVVHASLYRCRPDWSIPPIRAVYDDLFYVVQGRCWVEHQGERLEGKPGDLFIWRLGHAYSAGHDPHDPVSVYSTGFLVRGPGQLSALGQASLPDRLRVPAAAQKEYESLFARLASEQWSSDAFAPLAAQAALLTLLTRTLRLIEENPQACTGQTGPWPTLDERVVGALEWMERRLGERISLSDLARAASLTPSHFAKRFRLAVGQSPMAYLRTRRVEAARSLLVDGNLKVAAVAQAVGFDDPYHFSRVFRQVVGMSPAHFAAGSTSTPRRSDDRDLER